VERCKHRLLFIRPYELSNGSSYQIQMAFSFGPSPAGLWEVGL